MKTNLNVRIAQLSAGVPQWKVAKWCNVGESTFSRWMREEMPEEQQKAIIQIIQAGDDIEKRLEGRRKLEAITRPHQYKFGNYKFET